MVARFKQLDIAFELRTKNMKGLMRSLALFFCLLAVTVKADEEVLALFFWLLAVAVKADGTVIVLEQVRKEDGVVRLDFDGSPYLGYLQSEAVTLMSAEEAAAAEAAA